MQSIQRAVYVVPDIRELSTIFLCVKPNNVIKLTAVVSVGKGALYLQISAKVKRNISWGWKVEIGGGLFFF